MVGNNLLWWRIPVFCLLCHSIGHICPVVDCHNVLLDVLQPIGIPHQLLVGSKHL
jgi:hypothetical protein